MSLTTVNEHHESQAALQTQELVCMTYAPSDAAMDVSLVEKLSFNLSQGHSTREFNCTLRWLIYKIVEANHGITYVQLKKILRGEYGIDKRIMDTAISSLTSPTLFDCLNKWRNPKMETAGAEIGIHLFVKGEESAQFQEWKSQILVEFPELLQFRAPVLPARKAHHPRKER